MFAIKSFFRKIKIVLFLVVLLLSVNMLNATTIIYFEYDPIEDITFRITEVDGVPVSIEEVDNGSFE